MSVEIRLLGPEDTPLLDQVAEGVFDDPVAPASLRHFLATPNHHLVVARDKGEIVGFVSAVHYHHPDKAAPELWLNEFGVAPIHEGQGIGGALLDALLAHARRLGCSDAWVLTDRINERAMRLYASRTEIAPSDHVMFTFRLADRPRGD